jgi:hypothetical protein
LSSVQVSFQPHFCSFMSLSELNLLTGCCSGCTLVSPSSSVSWLSSSTSLRKSPSYLLFTLTNTSIAFLKSPTPIWPTRLR